MDTSSSARWRSKLETHDSDKQGGCHKTSFDQKYEGDPMRTRRKSLFCLKNLRSISPPKKTCRTKCDCQTCNPMLQPSPDKKQNSVRKRNRPEDLDAIKNISESKPVSKKAAKDTLREAPQPKCRICQKRFKTLVGQLSHLRHIHNVTKRPKPDNGFESSEEGQEEMDDNQAVHPEAGEGDDVPRGTTRPTTLASSGVSDTESSQESRGNSPTQDDEPSGFKKCNICQVVLPYSKSQEKLKFKNHQHAHYGLRPYPCPTCLQYFASPIRLLKHVERKHSN